MFFWAAHHLESLKTNLYGDDVLCVSYQHFNIVEITLISNLELIIHRARVVISDLGGTISCQNMEAANKYHKYLKYIFPTAADRTRPGPRRIRRRENWSWSLSFKLIRAKYWTCIKKISDNTNFCFLSVPETVSPSFWLFVAWPTLCVLHNKR